MNRKQLEEKTKAITQDLANKIQESPIGAALVFVGLGFVVGVFRGITVPLLLVGAVVYGVFWLFDGGKSKDSSDKQADVEDKKEEEGDSLH